MTDEVKTWVEAIRADILVGRGTCSTIDECVSDEDLVDGLTAAYVRSSDEAVKWAIDLEFLRVQNDLNYRQGTADDPELAIYRAFKAKRAARYARQNSGAADRIDGYDRDDLGESPDF